MSRSEVETRYLGDTIGRGDDFASPQILSRNTILPFKRLDSGDVIECYTMVRMAKLENQHSWSSHQEMSDINSNKTDHHGKSSSSNILVQKTAIAFRYKPKSTSPSAMAKGSYELTLEYGPQRTGTAQMNEAMPIVNGDLQNLDGGLYMSWENHGKLIVRCRTGN